jgi:plasmid stability protein
MSDILIRNLSAETVELLKQRAKRHNRSLQAEVKTILEELEPPKRTPEEIEAAHARSRAFSEWAWEQTKDLPQTLTGTEIIRRAREGYRD